MQSNKFLLILKVYDGVGADMDVDFDVFVEDWSNF